MPAFTEPRQHAAHIARAALESIAFQSAAPMQFQADRLGIPVVRPQVVETTALDAAKLAGLAVGVYRDLEQLAARWRVQRGFNRRCRASARPS